MNSQRRKVDIALRSGRVEGRWIRIGQRQSLRESRRQVRIRREEFSEYDEIRAARRQHRIARFKCERTARRKRSFIEWPQNLEDIRNRRRSQAMQIREAQRRYRLDQGGVGLQGIVVLNVIE